MTDLQIKRESKLLLKEQSAVFDVLENEDCFLVIYHSFFEPNTDVDEEYDEEYDEDEEYNDDNGSIDSYEYKKDMESDIELEDEQYVNWTKVYALLHEYKEYESEHLSAI